MMLAFSGETLPSCELTRFQGSLHAVVERNEDDATEIAGGY